MLTDEQLKLEEAMSMEAITRQTKENTTSEARGEWSNTRAGSTYLNHIMNKTQLVPMISSFLTPKKGPGRNHAMSHLLIKTGLDIDTIAYLTVKGCLNFLSIYARGKRAKRTSVGIKVAGVIHDEWRVRIFQNTDERTTLIKKLSKDFDKRAYPKAWRKKTIMHYFDEEQVSWSGWTMDERTKIGGILLTIFMEATGYAKVSDCGTYVEPTEDFIQHLMQMMAAQAPMFCLYRPMVVPPRPWSQEDNLFKGGYLSDKVMRYGIIKGASPADKKRIREMDWSKILPAINAMQDTPWRVSKDMLEAVEWSYFDMTKAQANSRDYKGIGKLPCCEEEQFPEMPWNYAEDEDVKKAHNRACFDVRDRRREAKGRRISAVMVLAIAKQMKEYPTLYMPHNLDSRGRAYPIPAFLNPQGPDYVKALLEFSKGQPVDATALRWIAIAGANAYGKDKVSLEERIQWVTENEDMILSIASDYRGDVRWLQAGEPFQFLRFCFEWLQYKTEGLGYMSHMVVPVDATCSGLQHYAAMLRCEELGKSVNLIPGYDRQDIYGDVAEHTISLLMDDGTQAAQDWIAFGLDRKMTKRQVMVVPYAGKFSSCLSYTREAAKEKMLNGVMPAWDINDNDTDNERIGFLAKAIWQGIDAKVERGKSAMQWLSKIASDYSKAMNKTGVPVYARRMRWFTPDGFEVSHFREEEAMKRVETTFEGRIRLCFYAGTGKLSPKDMALAVAPNFVHALDATHLRMTIMKGLQAGITDYAMIHDSFGVHASRMSEFLAKAVKPAFVQMYEEHDVLSEFAACFENVCKIPSQPERGNLDLQGVLRSEFFFS